jgi:hypothetical protein
MKDSSEDSGSQDVRGQNFLVVGAGIRGLFAAYELIRNGVSGKNIKIIDSAKNVGGAINPEQTKKMSAAEFIDDNTNNKKLHEIINDLEHKTKRKIIRRKVKEDEKIYIGRNLYYPDDDVEKAVIDLLNLEKNKCKEEVNSTDFKENDKKSLDQLFDEWSNTIKEDFKKRGLEPDKVDNYFDYLRKSYSTFNGIANNEASALTFILQAQVIKDKDGGKDILELFPGEKILINSAELVLALKEYLTEETEVEIATETTLIPKNCIYEDKKKIIYTEGDKQSNVIFAIGTNSMAKILPDIDESFKDISKEIGKYIKHAKWKKAFIEINDPTKVENFPVCNFVDKKVSVNLWQSEAGVFTFFYSGELREEDLATMFNKVTKDEGMECSKILAKDIETLKWHNDKANCSLAIGINGFTKLLDYQEELGKRGVYFVDDIGDLPRGFSFGYVDTAAEFCEVVVSKAIDSNSVKTTVNNPKAEKLSQTNLELLK